MNDMQNLLIESGLGLPLSFAIWRSEGSEVLVSNSLKSLILANSNIIDTYTFIRLAQKTFGSFLNSASEKLESGCDHYSSTIILSGHSYRLSLTFNEAKGIYTFVANKASEPEGKNSKQDIEKILDSIPIYIWQKDRNLQITYCNDAYAKAVDSTKERVVTENTKLIPNKRRCSGYPDQNPYSSKAKKTLEHVVINGSRRLLSVVESPFLQNNKSVGLAIDITEQEEVERSYKSYKKQTEEILNNISVPIATFDADTVLIFANSALIKLFSLEGLDLYGNCKLSDIMDYLISNGTTIASQDIHKYRDDAMKLFQTIIEPHCSLINLRNGNTMAVTISPNQVGGLIFSFEDITDKIALKREVNSISAIQIDTLNHLSEGVIVFGADNRIKIINSAAREIWETEQKSEGDHIIDFFHSAEKLFDSGSEAKLLGSKLINAAIQRVEFSETIKLSSGRTINCSYVPLPDGLNLARFLDISDGANLEKALKEKNDIVSQIDKLKSNLISNTSYELRAPLQTIKGFAEILLNDYFGKLNDKQREYCLGIMASVTRVTEVVDAVISLANIEAGQMKIRYTEVKLLKFIQDAINLFKDQAAAKNVSISSDFSDDKFVVFIDEPSMKQVMFHLIARSLRTAPVDGTITISVDNQDSDYFELTISDDGMVLSEEDLERTQKTLVDNSSNGKLDRSIEFGLVLANNIIKLHNGTMSINSTKDIGNVVTCKIPVKQFLQ